MVIALRERTVQTVITYFRMTRDPEIRRYLPQKAATEKEALEDFEKTQQPGTASYGRTIYCDGSYVGDVWCYGIGRDVPNAMVSYCVFNKAYWGQGIGSKALGLFLGEIAEKFGLESVGAFTFSANAPSIRVLLKNGFQCWETFTEEGLESKYFQKALNGKTA